MLSTNDSGHFTALSSAERTWLGISLVSLLVTILAVSHAARKVLGHFDRNHQATTAVRVVEDNGDEFRVAFLGSSHVFTGIDPDLISVPSVNLSGAAFNIKSAITVYRHYQTRLSGIELVVVEMSPATLYYDTIAFREFDCTEFFRWKIPATDLPLSGTAMLKAVCSQLMPSLQRPLFTEWLTRRGTATPADSHYARPGYAPLEGRLTSPEKAAADAGHHFRLGHDDPKSNLAALVDLSAELKSRGLKMAVLIPPHHEAYWKSQSHEHRRQTEEAIEYLKVQLAGDAHEIWDCRTVAGIGASEFADGHHLNRDGSVILSSYLNRKVQRCLPGEVF